MLASSNSVDKIILEKITEGTHAFDFSRQTCLQTDRLDREYVTFSFKNSVPVNQQITLYVVHKDGN